MEKSKIEIEDLSSIIRKKKSFSKPICGVYFLFLDDELVYIGSSKNCQIRFDAHHQNKEFNFYYIQEMPEGVMKEVEKVYIYLHKPPLNKLIESCVYLLKDYSIFP